jgi:hypothetical protein
MFQNVQTGKIGEVGDLLFKTLEKVANDESGFDSKRMEDIINTQILQNSNNVEENPHSVIQFATIGHFLYGKSDSELDHYMNTIARYQKLKAKPASFWLQLLKE